MQHITGISRQQMRFSSLEDTISPDNQVLTLNWNRLVNNTGIYNKAQKQVLKNEINKAQNNALTAKSSLKSALKVSSFQDETFRVANQKYELGLIRIYDFIESRNRLLKAQSDLVKLK